MDLPQAVLEKIRSGDLRDEVAAETPNPRTVIVELDLPAAKLEMTSPPGPGGVGRPRFRFEPQSPSTTSEIDGRIASLSNGIAEILGRPPETFLATSGSFVIEANGEQIGRIARMPTVSAIWPNTRRQR
ncbi:hypothetical protein [uncultured Methylobacterium sp.]|uniref:hypothetical protein n=1 Tax=uncultured Methylobacterium sp. TaxID=157278 RepID=UPI0026053B1E|nr:hypothetical protein [uncultured Methylobacterium sp.]